MSLFASNFPSRFTRFAFGGFFTPQSLGYQFFGEHKFGLAHLVDRE
jgi:hypothetical protein